MQDLGDIAFVENALFSRDEIEHETRIALDPPRVSSRRSSCSSIRSSFAVDAVSPRSISLSLDCGRAHTDMDSRLQCDPLLFEGTTINANVETGKSQMPVLAGKPSIPEGVEVIGAAGPKLVDNFAGIVALRPSVGARDCDLLRPETVVGQWPQRRHHVDVRIAGSVVIDPVGDHAASDDVPLHEISD